MSDREWQWVESLGHWALSWTLVVLAVAAWIRKGSADRTVGPAVRYGAWLWATFAGAALAPIIAGIVPRVSWRDVVASVAKPPAPRPPRTAGFRSWFERIAAAGPHDRERAGALAPAPPGPASPPGARAQGSEVRREGRAWDRNGRWIAMALVAWVVGFGVFAIRIGWAWLRVRALLRAGTTAAQPELVSELELAREALGLRRRVRVVVHPEIQAPMCVGLLWPTIWPAAANCPMTPTQRRTSLTHELAHLRQHDDWVALLAEVWRALCWFYLPVHWTLARLQREREYRCDDVASSQAESLQTYARWLLDLAPVRVEPPLLASSLLGGADLAGRVRRLLDGAKHDARPLSRSQITMLAALAVALLAVAGSVRFVGLAARAAEDEPADAPLPKITAEALREKIRAAWRSYDAGLIEIAFDEEQDRKMGRGQDNERLPRTTVKFPGRFQWVSDGRRWRTEYDSMMQSSNQPDLTPDRSASGFDGSRHFEWKVRANHITFGQSEIRALTLTPRALFWPEGENLLELLGTVGTKVGQVTFDSVRCYSVEQVTGDWRTVYLVSPRRGFLGVEMARYHRGRPYLSHRLGEPRMSDRGLWVPHKITYELVDIRDDGTSHLELRRAMRVVRFDATRTFAREDFEPKMPLNVDVTDLTLGIHYCNDPWWPEAGKLLREQFDWPKPDLKPLENLETYSGETINGKQAPPIQATTWVNSEPLDWAKLRGKVVLVQFTALAGGQEVIPALGRLAEVYKPAGLEVLTFLGVDDVSDDARQFVRELKIEHPVAIDQPSARELGATRKSFGIAGEESTMLVDHLGKVHRFARGKLIETLVALLREAGSKDVQPLSLETAQFTPAMEKAVDRAWQEWVAEAPAGGKIVGTISDAEGHPLAGAQVRVTVEMNVLMVLSAHFQFGGRKHHDALTASDGGFVVPGLCKGNYTLRIASPGRATVERAALVGPDLSETSIKVVLAQGDTISGRVLDESGLPLAGAEATISKRELLHPDGRRTYYNGFLEMKRTDAQGRFLFRKLPEGDYNLRFAAEGFAPETREHVLAGADNLEATLLRTRNK